MAYRIVYLMRGLPSCGKSHMARRLVGSEGVVLETDQYFYTEVGEDSGQYDYDAQLLTKARDWNFARFQRAIAAKVSPIAVDRGNGLNAETKRYATYAVDHGYAVELKEPDSPWWLELRQLLANKKEAKETDLNAWAERLAAMSQSTHRVSVDTIRQWMNAWRHNLTIQDVLTFSHQSTHEP